MKMTVPKIKVESGKTVDITNYIYTLKDIKNGFYEPKGFYILPYIPKIKGIAGKTIYIPDVGINIYDSEEDISKHLEENLKSRKINIGKYEEYLSLNFKNYWKDLCNIFSYTKLSNIKEVVVYVTNVGSGGRYISDNIDKDVLGVCIRSDMPLQQTLSLMLIGILNIIGYKENYTWNEINSIREWLKESTVLNKYFPHHFPLLDGLRNTEQQAKYSFESVNYLEKLGAKTKIELEDSGIKYNGDYLRLSSREFSLFKLLYSNRGSLVDYDTIFSEVWGNNIDSFSLYSISKLVERVRKKLKSSHVSTSLIQSYKGKGYYIS